MIVFLGNTGPLFLKGILKIHETSDASTYALPKIVYKYRIFRHSPCNPQRPLQSLNFIAAKINKEVKSAKPDISNDVKCNKRYFA